MARLDCRSYRGLCFVAPLLTISVACSPVPVRGEQPQKIGAAARSFPDSRSRILVFDDQLPGQMTDAQWQFCATHYVGSQKETRTWVERMRQLNPGFLMLHYQLAVGTGPAQFVVGDSWTNDFQEVTKHEDWFVHDASGHRLLQPAWDWYVMDIRFRDDGKPTTGFPSYWTKAAIARMRLNEDDGCFADSYTQDILMNQLKPASPWFTSAEANAKSWLPELNQFGAYCANALHSQPEKFYFLPNLGGLVTTWDRYTNFLVGDGGMNEGFCSSGPGQYNSVADWKLEMTHVLQLASAGKIVLCQTGVDPANADYRWFIVGAYLLTKGPRSYINMIHKSTLEWYPEYTTNLGAYFSEPAPDVETYWRKDLGLYVRDYEHGMVLVNPGGTAVKVEALPGPMNLVAAVGGGAVGPDGDQPGRLEMHVVTSVTVPAHSARVLLSTK